MWISGPFRRTLAYSSMVYSSALSLLSTGVVWCLTGVLAEVLNAGLAIRALRIKLAFSNFDWKTLLVGISSKT
jgi:hypothetical protein